MTTLVWTQGTQAGADGGLIWTAAGEAAQFRVGRITPGRTTYYDATYLQHGTPLPGSWFFFASIFMTLEAAQAECVDFDAHLVALRALPRHDLPRGRWLAHTPWGQPQDVTEFGPGVTVYSTAGHGGFHLDTDRQAAMPAHMRNDSPWYEEDCQWCKVALAFPELFTAREVRQAQQTYDQWCTPAAIARHNAQMAEWQAQARTRTA